jgi:transposase
MICTNHALRARATIAAVSIPLCGGEMRKVGEDVTRILDYIPGHFEVVRHVRPAFSCRRCESMVQRQMPSLPIERGQAGAGLLAHILVGKYCDHLPLYRQSGIYAREGVALDRATMAAWVGRRRRGNRHRDKRRRAVRWIWGQWNGNRHHDQ